MFTIGETRPNCDLNEPQQEDAQETRQIRRRTSNETQREQRRKRRHQETTELRQKTTSLQINCPPSPSYIFLVISNKIHVQYVRLTSTAKNSLRSLTFLALFLGEKLGVENQLMVAA